LVFKTIYIFIFIFISKFYKYIFLDFDIWKDTSVEIQNHVLRQYYYFINKNNSNYLNNITILFNYRNSIIKKFALALREEVFAKELIPKVVEIIMICLKHHFTKNQLKILASYISSTLPKGKVKEIKKIYIPVFFFFFFFFFFLFLYFVFNN